MSTIAAQHMFRPQIKHLEINASTLAVYEWPKPQSKPKAHIVMVHGLGEHMGRYNHVAFALNHAGYAVTGYDHVGHGLSTGARGDIKDAQQLVNDLEQVLHAIKPDHEGLATVLLGHSMGGLVVQRAVAAHPGLADAVVMSSPALAAFTNPLQKLLLATLPRWFPHLRVDNGLQLNWLARDAQVIRDYKEDALVHPLISAGLAAWIVQQGEMAVLEASQWQTSTLLLYAGQDKLVNPKGSADFAKNASPDYVQSHCFNVMYHEIFNDPEKHLVLQKISQWLDKKYSTA